MPFADCGRWCASPHRARNARRDRRRRRAGRCCGLRTWFGAYQRDPLGLCERKAGAKECDETKGHEQRRGRYFLEGLGRVELGSIRRVQPHPSVGKHPHERARNSEHDGHLHDEPSRVARGDRQERKSPAATERASADVRARRLRRQADQAGLGSVMRPQTIRTTSLMPATARTRPTMPMTHAASHRRNSTRAPTSWMVVATTTSAALTRLPQPVRVPRERALDRHAASTH